MEYTYCEYKNIIEQLLEKGYTFKGYDDWQSYEKVVLLRHDVDVSLESAAKVSKIENSIASVKSTYFILISSDMYNPYSFESLSKIYSILDDGNELGLHFDELKYFTNNQWNINDMIEKILFEKDLLEKIVGKKINSVSMHRPTRNTLDSNLTIPDMINSYSELFFKSFKYISDSYHRWRENVYDVINQDHQKLHILTHPFWYHEKAMSRTEVFQQFISAGEDTNRRLLENSILPPGVSLKESIKEDSTTGDLQ